VFLLALFLGAGIEMNNSLFTDLDQTLERSSPREAVDRLCIMLKNKGDYHSLFEALMLQTRLKLGLPAMLSPTGEELTPEQKADYEKAVRDAARTVGQHFLDDKNLLNAWPYYRMIGETEPMAKAMETWEPGEADDEAFPAILDMAIQQGAAPVRGVELLLKKYGLCNAITMMGQNFPHSGVTRQKAVGILVEALYRDLRNSLAVHAKELTGDVPDDNASIAHIVEGNAKLTEDDCYHVDVSHLSSVVQYALELPPGEVSRKVIDLCVYGSKLAPRFQPNSDPPFEEGYRDYLHYYRALNGIDSEAGLNHFRLKAESVEQGTEMTAPAEVYVHLLSQLGRHGEALHAFARYLTQANPRQLACPMPTELARQSGEYAALAELCLRRGDAVGYAVARAAESSKA
jgi:hypothetical protein